MSGTEAPKAPIDDEFSDDDIAFLEGIITVRSKAGNKYSFKMPSIMDRVRLQAKKRNLVWQVDPGGRSDTLGFEGTDGIEAQWIVWASAAFELFLKGPVEGPDSKWPYSAGADDKPVVDSSKFPDDKIDELLEVGAKLQQAMTRFRSGRVSDGKPAGKEAAAGGGNPGT